MTPQPPWRATRGVSPQPQPHTHSHLSFGMGEGREWRERSGPRAATRGRSLTPLVPPPCLQRFHSIKMSPWGAWAVWCRVTPVAKGEGSEGRAPRHHPSPAPVTGISFSYLGLTAHVTPFSSTTLCPPCALRARPAWAGAESGGDGGRVSLASSLTITLLGVVGRQRRSRWGRLTGPEPPARLPTPHYLRGSEGEREMSEVSGPAGGRA